VYQRSWLENCRGTFSYHPSHNASLGCMIILSKIRESLATCLGIEPVKLCPSPFKQLRASAQESFDSCVPANFKRLVCFGISNRLYGQPLKLNFAVWGMQKPLVKPRLRPQISNLIKAWSAQLSLMRMQKDQGQTPPNRRYLYVRRTSSSISLRRTAKIFPNSNVKMSRKSKQ